ncbi:Solute carrier family 10 member 6 [Merluccius polli]|uniref:Solute carrier family 10 member 6 n=1 Tax=Merluccius polli TaxID=89951 RepID=A0AA47NMK3_MERPO|nr:Solute carrier family 10 member 6 [Merluccius polli]
MLTASGSLHAVLGVFLTAMLAMVVFSLGCTVEASKLWFHLRRPWGVLVGLGCQFGLMPLTAYLLASGFGVRPLQAVAVVMMGCCPGGVISNIVTYWLDGDMDLSITMTTCSTMLALGMMPLCLYAYTHFWVETAHIKIPYSNMGITLLTLVVPAACGMAVNYKWPKAAKCILKVGSVVGGVMILVVGVASALMYHGSWQTDTSLIVIASIFPLIGYSAGFVIAVICRQPWPRCRTIAMETGAQNVQISSTMLQLSFPPEQLVVMFTFPLMYGCFQLLHSLLLVSVQNKVTTQFVRCPQKRWVFLKTHQVLQPVCSEVANATIKAPRVRKLWKHIHVWRSGKCGGGGGGGGEEIQSVPDRREHLDDVIHAGRGETNAAFEHDAHCSDGPVPRSELGPKQDADVEPAATPSHIQDDA